MTMGDETSVRRRRSFERGVDLVAARSANTLASASEMPCDGHGEGKWCHLTHIDIIRNGRPVEEDLAGKCDICRVRLATLQKTI